MEATLDPKQESSLSHIWHTWINKYQEVRTANGEERAHSLYEFKSMLDFLRYGHRTIQEAFEGKLPSTHQQCSHQLPVPILNNKLKCALGEEVIACPILMGLKAKFEEEFERVYPFNDEKAHPHLPKESLYLVMSRTCAWHILSKSTRMQEGWGGVDTSEGDRKSTRLNSSHQIISYAVFCLKKKRES